MYPALDSTTRQGERAALAATWKSGDGKARTGRKAGRFLLDPNRHPFEDSLEAGLDISARGRVNTGMAEKFLLHPIIVAVLSPALALAAALGPPSWTDTPTVPGDTQMTLNWRPGVGAFTSCRVRYRTSNSSEPWAPISNLPASLILQR
jgi:hypothetical protein